MTENITRDRTRSESAIRTPPIVAFSMRMQGKKADEFDDLVDDDELNSRMKDGLNAMRDEVERNGTDVDKECLSYVLDMEAGITDKTFPNGKRDCDAHGDLLPLRARLTDVPCGSPTSASTRARRRRC